MKTEKNIREFAEDIIDGWDLETLIDYAVSSHEEWLTKMDPEEFEKRWNEFYYEENDDI